MASLDQNDAVEKDWVFANPWAWLGAGLALALWSWLWTMTFNESASDRRIVVLAVGLLSAGIGLWLRWSDRRTAYLVRSSTTVSLLARALMGGLFSVIALGVTGLLILTLFEGDQINSKPGVTTLIWLAVVPASWFAARRCLMQGENRLAINAEEEIGPAFGVAAIICFVGSVTVGDWDTIRIFLRVVSAVAILASALTLVSPRLRRLVLGFLLALHFGGICTVALTSQPSPPILQQLRVRIYRPYLEFTGLNEGYGYFAPEPGPSGYIWFRIIYDTPDGTGAATWYKIPDMDDTGRHGHPVGLEYQRFLTMTARSRPSDPTPEPSITDGKAQPLYANRLALAVAPAGVAKPMTGKQEMPPEHVRIPLHPRATPMQQIRIPTFESKRVLSSYARFAARKFARHPDDWRGEMTLKSVKVYAVIHQIIPAEALRKGVVPTDPELYRAFYMGNHRADGKRIENGDPYLYWLLPILREAGNDRESRILDYCRLHAGDARWVRPPGWKEWVEGPIP